MDKATLNPEASHWRAGYCEGQCKWSAAADPPPSPASHTPPSGKTAAPTP
jgi:hypothetical protein